MSHGTGPWPPVDPYTGQLPLGTFSSPPPPPPPQGHSWRPPSFPHWQFTLMLEVSSKSWVLLDLTSPHQSCVQCKSLFIHQKPKNGCSIWLPCKFSLTSNFLLVFISKIGSKALSIQTPNHLCFESLVQTSSWVWGQALSKL